MSAIDQSRRQLTLLAAHMRTAFYAANPRVTPRSARRLFIVTATLGKMPQAASMPAKTAATPHWDFGLEETLVSAKQLRESIEARDNAAG